jgi:hypothetical protein
MRAGDRRREDWYADADLDRPQIFVPAIMGAGILISLYTMLRDAWQAHRSREASRHTALAAHATAGQARTGVARPAPRCWPGCARGSATC